MTARNILAYLFLAVTWGLSFLVLLLVVRAFGWVGAVTPCAVSWRQQPCSRWRG